MSNKRNVRICLFEKNTPKNTVLLGNGDVILDKTCVQCTVTEGLDGSNELDAIFITDKEGLYKHINDEVILKVQMDYGDEIYRVVEVNKQEKEISVFARQITISETLDMWIEDVRPTNTSGLTALTNLKNNSIGKKDIEVFSDIDKLSTAYYQRMSMYQAIHDCDQSFLKRWGGEVERRGYNLTINKKIGSDRGVEIRSKKNLTGFEANTNIDNVVTRIRPVGYDGIYAGKFVDSPLINNYSSIKTREIEYSDVKVADENNPNEGFATLADAQKELIRRAELEFTENHIDELRAEYRINFIYLEQTEEYKNFVQAERVYLGDIVSVFEENHNINILVRVISRKYDVLNQKVIEIELSNTDISSKTLTSSDILAELQSIVSNSNNNNVQDIIQSMINSGIKDSYVVPRQNELIVADNKDLNLARNVIRINKNGIGFSKNGINGNYEYGFTIDGVINASLISTGILSTILIQNADGSLQIDLSGKKGIMTRQNGKNAIELEGTNLRFYDWDGQGGDIGRIASTRFKGDADKPAIALVNNQDSYSTITYDGGNTLYSYIRFDKNRVVNDSYVPITIFENVENRGVLWFAYGENSMYNTNTNHLQTLVSNGYIIGNRATNKTMFRVEKDYSLFYNSNGNGDYARFSPTGSYFSNGNGTIIARFNPQEVRFVNSDTASVYTMFTPTETYFRNTNTGNRYATFNHNEMRLGDSANNTYGLVGVNDFWLQVDGGRGLFSTNTGEIQSDRNFVVNGNFRVTGNKNCIQETDSFGNVAYYSVEDCESYLTDRTMELQFVEETKQGTFEKKILLDEVYKESVNLDIDYTVEIIKQGWGDYRIKEQTKDYFIVESDRKDFTFKYVITGKRKGFEDKRNERVDVDTTTYHNRNFTSKISDEYNNSTIEVEHIIEEA